MGPPKVTLAIVQEQRNLKRRELDNLRRELESFYNEQKHFNVAAKASETVQLRATLGAAREREVEEQAALRLEQAKQRQSIRMQQAAEEDRLAEHLLQQNQAAAARQTALERLHQGSPQLRELRQAIAAAQVAVERGLQLQEREYASTQEKQYEAALDHLATQKLQQAQEADMAAKTLRFAASVHMREGLDQQMEEQLHMREHQQEVRERERQMVDAIVARIEIEDHQAQTRRVANMERAQQAMQESVEDRKRNQAIARAQEMEQERRIAEYQRQQQERSDEKAAKAALKQAGNNRTYETIKARLEAEEAAAQEEQRLVDLLRAEEVAAAARREAAERAARQAEMRAAMMADNQAQLRYREEQQERQRKEDEAFKVATLQRMAEDDRLEQLSAQHRREKTLAHRREVERLLEHRRALFESAREQELAEEEAALQAQEAEQALIEAERQRLLAQAEHLHALLPRSVLLGGPRREELLPARLY